MPKRRQEIVCKREVPERAPLTVGYEDGVG